MIHDGVIPPDGVDVVEGELEVPLVVGGHLLVDTERHEAGDVEDLGMWLRGGGAQDELRLEPRST